MPKSGVNYCNYTLICVGVFKIHLRKRLDEFGGVGRKSLEFRDQSSMGNFGEYSEDQTVDRNVDSKDNVDQVSATNEDPIGEIYCAKELVYIVSMT